jgi:hypothetical protein
MNTKTYLQDLIRILDESVEWNGGVIMGLYQAHENADTETEYYSWLEQELPRLHEVNKKTLEARKILVEALKLVEHY